MKSRVHGRRRVVLALGAGALAPFASIAQEQPGKFSRVGFLSPASASTYGKFLEVLKAALRDFGYREGKTIEFEIRWAEGTNERLSGLAEDLLRRNVDVIVTHGTPGVLAAKKATATVPIVCAAMADPAVSGLVASLSRPGANITGVAILSQELYGKRLALLLEAVPRIRRVAFLLNPDNPIYGPVFQSLQPLAKSLRVELRRFEIRGAHELKSVFSAMAKEHVDAVELVEDGALDTFAPSIVDLATKERLPSVTGSEFSGFGALIGYGVSRDDLFRRAAYYVDKILKGAKPGDLPIEQPTQFEFIVSRKTARAIGVAIPPSLLERADKVIE